MPWNIRVDAAYVGNRGRKLPINGRAINEVPLSEREKAIERLGGNASYLSTLLPNPFAGLVPGTIEAFNFFNTPIYGAPDVGVNSSRFGMVTPNQINFPRHVQLGLRVLF